MKASPTLIHLNIAYINCLENENRLHVVPGAAHIPSQAFSSQAGSLGNTIATDMQHSQIEGHDKMMITIPGHGTVDHILTLSGRPRRAARPLLACLTGSRKSTLAR